MSVETPRQAHRHLCPAASAIYSHLLPMLKHVAREQGYALAVHGSMTSDFDLLACPWTDEATDAETLIEALRASVNGVVAEGDRCGNPTHKPHGRLSWVFYFDEKCAENYYGPYLDISVMPRIVDSSAG